MINPLTGNLKIQSKDIIFPHMLKEEFESLKLNYITIYKSLDLEIILLKNNKINDYYYNLNLHFYSGKLSHITFTFQNEIYSDNQGWANWSKELEMENLERFKAWISNVFGNKTNLKWGNIKALYDAKTGMSLIELHYKSLD